jgi:hypothetical protein
VYASVVWNYLTLRDTNKIGNISKKVCKSVLLCLLQSDITRNYDLIVNLLNFITIFFSRRRHLNVLFMIIFERVSC